MFCDNKNSWRQKIEKYGTRNLRRFSFSWVSNSLFLSSLHFVSYARLCIRVAVLHIHFFNFLFCCLSREYRLMYICVGKPECFNFVTLFLMDFLWLFCYKCNQVPRTSNRHTAFSFCCNTFSHNFCFFFFLLIL